MERSTEASSSPVAHLPAPADGVSVVLPVHEVVREGEDGVTPSRFAESVRCILEQSLTTIELLIVLNGADGQTQREAKMLADQDKRARVVEVPQAGLAGALNVGMRQARHDLIARMDADDGCHPERLTRQFAAMRARPELAGLGTGYEKIAPDGSVLARVIPPCDPGELRWRLLLGNQFAHGSMMLRRDAVFAVGGYDENVRRAQDFDLWLRLAARYELANLPEVLYRYHARPGDDRFGACPEQAATVVERLTACWCDLKASTGSDVASALRAVLSGRIEPGVGAGQIEDAMTAKGASVEGLLGWLWLLWRSDRKPTRVEEAGKLSVLREAGRRLREEGIPAVWLWGAGQHTLWLLSHADELGLGILGIVDDASEGRRVCGFTVVRPDAIPSGDTTLISSDAWEDAIWAGSISQRSRGVDVRRLYTLTPGAGTVAEHAAAAI